MDSTPVNAILKFKPDTVLAVRKMYSLDKPGQMDEAIDLLENWVKKQGHFLKKDYPREYLERAIILQKGSIERAKFYMDNLCTLKTLMPHFFDKYDAKKHFEYLKRTWSSVVLPNLTDDNYRVVVAKFWNNDYTPNMFNDFYKFGALICEYSSLNEYCFGCIAILDYRDLNMTNFLSALNIVELNQAMNMLMKGYAYKLKAIHFVTSAKTIEVLIKILKKILTPKISNRIFVHTQLDTLYEHVPKDMLPEELNGDEKSIALLFDEWLDLLSTNENLKLLKEMYTEAVVDKSYKKIIEFSEINTGLDGTFRNLSVD